MADAQFRQVKVSRILTGLYSNDIRRVDVAILLHEVIAISGDQHKGWLRVLFKSGVEWTIEADFEEYIALWGESIRD